MTESWTALAWGIAALGWLVALILVLAWQRARARSVPDAPPPNGGIDPLSQLPDRARFLDATTREVNRSQRAGHALSVLLIDAGQLRWFNQHYGYDGGDRLLRHVAAACLGCVRDFDLIGRFSHKEFTVLLPDATLDDARIAAARLEAAITANSITLKDGRVVPVTVTIGIATLENETDTADDLLIAADLALARTTQPAGA
ncbi:diguanylate cyclase domain-containing protein [Jeongeupia naejangsanensis]|uniref:diguanylate cyclase n=1 Tax=Jeongeupia naejangsanensis TaxID=613195 RepID=A0ABS2BPH6_9NEIS|nr:diguanylate cyclase [Jeongeupia naejangsanensis]MBM3117522.1 diguanylate cyclase [Jeongeupia naejangsanensis]